jgi:hypothetical protein
VFDIIIKTKKNSFAALSIKNDSDFPIIIRQAGIDYSNLKVFGKNIANNPSDFFSEDILAQLDKYCKSKYNYGSDVEQETEELEEELNEN